MSTYPMKNDFLYFLKNPHQKFTGFFRKDFTLFLLLTILSFFAGYLKSLITQESFIDESDLNEFNSSKIFPIIFLIPLIEELVFRGFLQYKSRLIFIMSFVSMIFFLTSFIKQDSKITHVLIVLTVLGLSVFFNKKLYQEMLNFIDANTIIIILISSIFFGCIHLLNYDNFLWVNLLPISEKIIAGVFLCYIAKKYNIWHSYFFHLINNSIPLLIIWVYKLM
ncbi:CPBP family glutamic-type intramembrane protease [Flavobacterium weaverense]|uniref:CAAX prenyl protease-like protein n=2 Tax=Flavobacterium weaverense TaxID=271156 RepID=A0A3L9ZRG0_9FLAO|nr:CAAX prenyl protease-like protein [Flavobacterium weaverense]